MIYLHLVEKLLCQTVVTYNEMRIGHAYMMANCNATFNLFIFLWILSSVNKVAENESAMNIMDIEQQLIPGVLNSVLVFRFQCMYTIL